MQYPDDIRNAAVPGGNETYKIGADDDGDDNNDDDTDEDATADNNDKLPGDMKLHRLSILQIIVIVEVFSISLLND